MSEIPRHSYRWKPWHAVSALALLGWSILITRDSWRDICRMAWVDEESSHVLLVPIAVVWLLWIRRGRFKLCRPGASLLGTLTIALGWALWSTGYRYAIESFWHFGPIVMAVGCLMTVLGKDILFQFAPVFMVLVFLVPVPGRGRQYIAQPLQTTTARMTQSVSEVLGVPVGRSGNLLSINGQDVAVAEACNGMRMVFTLFLVSYVFAFVTPLKNYVRALILAASPLTAIVCNVVRLVPTIWVYGHFSKQAGERFHDMSAWVMLGVAFVLLMSIVRVLRWAMLPVSPFTLAANEG